MAGQVEEEDEVFEEEFVGSVDPSILHFLLASGDRISSKQVRPMSKPQLQIYPDFPAIT